eukprot:g1635.t1
MNAASAIYGLKYHCRCIASQLAELDKHSFFVGTTALRQDNEIHLIEFIEDTNEIVCIQQFKHKHEIWDIAASPVDKKLVFTVYNKGRDYGSTLWRLNLIDDTNPEEADASLNDGAGNKPTSVGEKECIAALPSDQGGKDVRRIIWEPLESVPKFVSLHENKVRLWDIENLDANGMSGKPLNTLNVSGSRLMAGTWDPHHSKHVVTANGTSLRGWDLRISSADSKSGSQTHHIEAAHRICVRDVDYNVNKPWHIVSGGDDGDVRFWDLRHPVDPIKTISGHSHWVTQTKCNPNHDQLVLTASTDQLVKLWRCSTISSAPVLEVEDDNETSKTAADCLINSFDEHEDSIYSTAWSACEPWVYASLSFDGRVVVGDVPSEEKYKILL